MSNWFKIKADKPMEEFYVLPEVFNEIADKLPILEEMTRKFENIKEHVGYFLVTDGSKFIGIDVQGYDYPRYKTEVHNNKEEVIDDIANGNVACKYVEEEANKGVYRQRRPH